MATIAAITVVFLSIVMAALLASLVSVLADRRTARRTKGHDHQIDALQAQIVTLRRDHHDFATAACQDMQSLNARIVKLEERNKP